MASSSGSGGSVIVTLAGKRQTYRDRVPHFYSTPKRVLVGRPLESAAAPHQRLSKTVGLAVFSSDAVASSAFATQEILHILVPVVGMAAVGYLGPISLLLVVLLLAIVVFSYRQTIAAYPNGGCSYDLPAPGAQAGGRGDGNVPARQRVHAGERRVETSSAMTRSPPAIHRSRRAFRASSPPRLATSVRRAGTSTSPSSST